MATIVHDALFTLTEEAAQRMVDNGLIEKCEHNHLKFEEFDGTIYHLNPHAPEWFGFATIPQAIIAAEQHAEEARNAENAVVLKAPDAPE